MFTIVHEKLGEYGTITRLEFFRIANSSFYRYVNVFDQVFNLVLIFLIFTYLAGEQKVYSNYYERTFLTMLHL